MTKARITSTALIALTLTACGGSPPPPPPTTAARPVEQPRVTEEDMHEARAYEYFKRMFIQDVPWCDSQIDFVSALYQMGVACSEIKDKSPREAFDYVRGIVTKYQIDGNMRRIRLALFNEALD